jgi:hypothetical protein
MRETRLSGSVEGVVSNHDPYSDYMANISDPGLVVLHLARIVDVSL